MASYATEIAQLKEIVNGSVTSVTVDGISTRFSISQAKKRLSELQRQDENSIAEQKVRPVIIGTKLGGCF